MHAPTVSLPFLALFGHGELSPLSWSKRKSDRTARSAFDPLVAYAIVAALSQAKKRKNYADYDDEAHKIDDSVHNAFLLPAVHASSNMRPNRKFPIADFSRNLERVGRESVFKFRLACGVKNEFEASIHECRGSDRLYRRVDCHVLSIYRIPVSACSRRPPPVSRSTTLASSPAPVARL